jgi:hypothetical protein
MMLNKNSIGKRIPKVFFKKRLKEQKFQPEEIYAEKKEVVLPGKKNASTNSLAVIRQNKNSSPNNEGWKEL